MSSAVPASHRKHLAMVLAAPFPAPRGTQAYVADLCQALITRGHRVHLFCYAGVGESLGQLPVGLSLHRAAALPGIDAVPGSAPTPARPANDAALLARLIATVPRLGPVLLHGHNHEGGLLAGLCGRILGRPVVYHVHSRLAEELPLWLGDRAHFVRRIGTFVDRLVPRLADSVVTLDPEMAAEKRAFGARHVVALPPGVRPTPSASVPVPPHPPTVVYAGNLDPYQDLPLGLAAVARLSRRLPRLRLRILTHDPPQAARRLACLHGVPAERLEILRPEGWEALQAATRAADVALVPRTTGGGYPIKLLNALSCGVPVVTTLAASKGLGEESGVLPADPTPEALAARLASVLAGPHSRREQLRARALRFAAAHPWEAVAEALEEVYRALDPVPGEHVLPPRPAACGPWRGGKGRAPRRRTGSSPT